MTVKFYFDLLSQPSRALYILFKVTKFPHEPIPVALRNGVHLTEEFKNDVSRFQKVPCIIDDGFKLSESVAILRLIPHKDLQEGLNANSSLLFFRYLKNSTDLIPDSLYPSELKARARVDEYLEWQHNNTRLTCAMYFQLMWLLPKLFGKESNPKQIAEMKKRMETCLDQIETIWLQDSKFIAGNSLTVADIFAACEIEQPRIAGYSAAEGRPKLGAWMERVKKELNPYYDEAHVVVEKAIAASKI